MIQPIPARGMRPSRIEIKSITERNSPPQEDGRRCSVPSSQQGRKHDAMASSSGRNSDSLARARPAAAGAPTKKIALLGLERRVHGLAILGGQGNFLRLFAELFMDECDSVIAWRQALDLKFAVRPSDREEGALRNVDEHPHPRMLVALHGQHDFFPRERLFQRRGLRWLRLVPLAIVLRSGVDIVGGGIAVDDRYGLAGDHSHHVRVIAAAALIELYGFLGDVEGAAAQAFLNVDENVREMAVRDDDILGHVCAFAGGILAHVYLGGLRRGAVELHNADDDGSRGWVNRRGGGRGGWSRCGLLFRGFFLATTRD